VTGYCRSVFRKCRNVRLIVRNSGPKRFEYDAKVGAWINTRDGERLVDLLAAELSELCKLSVKPEDLS
jgi:frataxin-like iron-binding protein CyaY